MKIAYIVPYVPNLIRTRPYNFINQLVGLGHEVTVFTLGSGKQDRDDVNALRLKVKQVYYQEQTVLRSLWNSITAVPTWHPLQSVYSWNSRLAYQLVNSILDDREAFDVIHVEHLRGSRYGRFVKLKFPHIPVIWDSVDCISHLFSQASVYSVGLFGRFVTRFELSRTRKMEGNLITQLDHVLVTSKTDRNALLELAPSTSKPSPISVLSNGVDLEYFHQNPARRRDLNTLVFSGKMSYHANIAMVKKLVNVIMPMIWEKHSNVQLKIVGKDPTPEILAFEADPRITVTGTVPDLRPFLWDSTIAVIPLVYGAGIQNKVLEAMACGTPVVTTSRALLSLKITPDRELLVADNDAEFSRSVVKLLENRELQNNIGSNGAAYVKKYHSWRDMTKELLTHYDEIVNKSKSKYLLS